jgi:hypothetical protein
MENSHDNSVGTADQNVVARSFFEKATDEYEAVTDEFDGETETDVNGPADEIIPAKDLRSAGPIKVTESNLFGDLTESPSPAPLALDTDEQTPAKETGEGHQAVHAGLARGSARLPVQPTSKWVMIGCFLAGAAVASAGFLAYLLVF